MKYKIKTAEDGLNIKVSEAGDKQEKLLEAFQECQEGRCSCPTDEYTKLDSLQIEKDEGAIHLHLTSKSEQAFNQEEISKCLEYMKGKITDS